MEPHYIINQETDKLNIFSDKDFFAGLPNEQKDIIKRFCLYSPSMKCWVSKAKAENSGFLRNKLDSIGFIFGGKTGEKPSFADTVEREQQSAENRAEHALKMAEKTKDRADRMYEEAKSMASVIPMGQPILVGHHSEKRDRRYREKIHNKFGNSFKEMDKAKYYEDKAASAAKTAKGAKYSDPFYLERRIKECDKDLRTCYRRLEGKFYTYSPAEPISTAEQTFYTERINQLEDKKSFLVNCMKKVIPGWEPKPEQVKKKGNKNRL